MSYRFRHPELVQEDDVVPKRSLVIVGSIVVAIAIAGGLIGAWLQIRAEAEVRPGRDFPERTLAVPGDAAGIETRHYAEPRAGRVDVQKARRVLGSYGWVDPERRIVRIPIEQAIEILAEDGRPGEGGGTP